MPLAIPKAVIEALRTRPESRLHIINNARKSDAAPLDLTSLASPNLFSLDINVFGVWIEISRWDHEYRSELPALKNALKQAKNLRRLRLKANELFNERDCQPHWVAQSQA